MHLKRVELTSHKTTATITRQANQLDAGDVIIAPDDTRHTVTEIEWHGLTWAWLTIHTDTGLVLPKTQDEAKLHTYEVEVVRRS